MKTVETCEQAPGCRREEEADSLLRIPAHGDGHHGDKLKDDGRCGERRDGADYVDMDLSDLKTATVIGEGNQTSVHDGKNNGGVCGETTVDQTDIELNEDDDKHVNGVEVDEKAASPVRTEECIKSKDNGQLDATQHEDIKDTDNKHESEQTDGVYLSRKSESDDLEEIDDDDDVSLVLSDEPCVTEDESHYITTHEIQLCELSDHEGDSDTGVGGSSTWDVEDDNVVYSFVDYAPAGAVDADAAERAERARGRDRLSESDPRDGGGGGAKTTCATSSDESASKTQRVHLSIKTTSRAINEPGNIGGERGNNNPCRARGAADGKLFIAAPRRLHLARNFKGKDINEYSSGTSSAVSELDDADKEVRSLTAKAFRSLAYPVLDALTFSTSSESSASESLNRWSAFVDLQYGNMSHHHQGLEHHHHHRHHQSMQVSHKNASFEIAKNLENKLGYKGVALASIKPPGPCKLLTLSGKPSASSSSSSSKQIELLGKLTGGGGVITLTETLNFRCNVNSTGGAAEERRSKFAQKNNAGGSRSADEVTNTLPSSSSSGQRRGGGGAAGQAARNAGAEAMEDTSHKKAVGLFASSVIKNVISKKIQFEQERKMERGEIREPQQPQQRAPSPGSGQQDPADSHKVSRKTLPRQSSKHSEADSENTIVCVDELGDIVDSGSNKSEPRAQQDETPLLAPETKLEPPPAAAANEAGGMDTKKGALEASAKSTLLRSQNSAFRSWRDHDGGELELPQEHSNKNDKSPQGRTPSDDTDARPAPGSGDDSKLTKMSHLFVPTIQLLADDAAGDAGHHQLPNMNYMNYSTRAPAYQGEGGGGGKLRSSGINTLYVGDSRSVVTSKSPEIKINLRSVRDPSKHDPFTVSKLRAPPCTAAATGGGSAGRTDDFRSQALAAALKGDCLDSKIPHFTVRDIRDNSGSKGKLQTPIHQVRDVRKLVKSSYHFVSLDNNNSAAASSSSTSSTTAAAAATDLHLLHAEPKKQQAGPAGSNRNLSVSPIIIKCQSVNTNSNGKQQQQAAEDSEAQEVSKRRPQHDETFDLDRSSPEGAKSGSSAPPHPGRPVGNTNTDSAEAGTADLLIKTETKTASKRQEKIPTSSSSSITDSKKPDSKMATSALEKLQAAVKTMEQLYVFDRNEWKRKSEPRQQQLADSHMLSLIGDGCGSPVEEGAVLSNLDMLGRRDSYPSLGRTPPTSAGSPAATAGPPEAAMKREVREMPRTYQSPIGRDDRHAASRSLSSQGAVPAAASKHVFSLASSQAAPTTTTSAVKAPQPRAGGTQSPYGGKACAPNSPKLPVSLKITQTKQHRSGAEARESHGGGGDTERSSFRAFSASADSEDYLTIPVKAHGSGGKSSKQSASASRAVQEKTSVYTFTSAGANKSQSQASSPPGAPPGWHGVQGYRRQEEESRQSPQQQLQQQRSSVAMETPTSTTIYHHPLSPLSQPQLYCFSPTITPAPTMDPFQPTQRKMLLDPTTGNFYLVDTPVQQTTRRLFDPETGQYVDVPMMPQQQMQPPMTMSPMPMSPLALSPTGAYGGHTYMIYPGGFMPAPATTMIPGRAFSQGPSSDAESGEKTSAAGSGGRGASEAVYVESPYYLASTGKSPHMMMSPFAPQQQQQQRQQQQQPQGFSGGGGGSKQPVISITSQQQGPRIIAPPSFDGTTMSFVVEHR